MTRSSATWLLPASILAAGAFIGVGLYLGLASRPADRDIAAPRSADAGPSEPKSGPLAAEPRTAAESRTAALPDDAPPPASGGGDAPSEAPAPSLTDATAEALLAEVYPRWLAACWDAADPDARRAGSYVAMLAFDPAGKLVMFGINEDRERSDPTVAQCLREQYEPLTIPAPGRAMTFEIPFDVP